MIILTLAWQVEIREMFEVADINKDGVLDIVEFGRMVHQNINMN